MNQPMLHRGFGLIFIAFLSFLLLACGGGGNNNGPGHDPDPGDGSQWVLSASVCEKLVPVSFSGIPTDPVALNGWPGSGPADLIVAKVRSSTSEDWTVTLVRDFPDQPTSVLVPLHPNGSPEGGAVTLTFGQVDANEEEFWCEQAHDFHIDPLPFVNTTTDAAATLRALRDLGETVAARYGQTLSSVRGMSPEQLPEHLYPLYFSAHLLGDASDALEAQLDDLPPDDRELLDRLLTHINFKQYLGSSDSELRVLGGFIDPQDLLQNSQDPAQNRAMLMAFGGGACSSVGVSSLSPMMSMSGWSADALSGTSGKTMDAMATAAGVIGLIPHPAAQGVSRVGGAMLFTVQTMLEGMSKLLPSDFTEADFRHIPHFFEEDSEDSGRWHSFEAQAASEGWRLDQAILEGVLVGVGTAGAKWGKWMESVVGRWDGLANEFAQNLVDMVILDGATGLVDATGETKTSFVEVAPRCWVADDFSDKKWTEVDFIASIQENPDDLHFGYKPLEAADGSIVVRPAPSHFGGATFEVSKAVEVGPIQIIISPPLKMVEPGEIVDFTVTVDNALDTRVLIRDGLGWQLEPDMDGDGSATFRYSVPDDRSELPLRITATSLSQGGLRGLPDAPERTGSGLLQDEDIVLFVSPNHACLEPGESIDFKTATLLGADAGPVAWSAVGGTITPSGRFTAGNTGSATITATLLDRDNIRALARVNIMDDCDACRWRASVGGITYGGAQINITPFPREEAVQLIQMGGPEKEGGYQDLDDLHYLIASQLQLKQPLQPGSQSVPSLFHATVFPGPLSGWSAPAKLIESGNPKPILDIPTPEFKIIRNELIQRQGGQMALIEGRVSGTMASVELPLPEGRRPDTRLAGASIEFVGTFHISEMSSGLMMTCNASDW